MSDSDISALYGLIRELTASHAEVRIVVARIDERQAAAADLSARVKTLEEIVARGRGAMWAASVMSGAVGAVAAFIAERLMK